MRNVKKYLAVAAAVAFAAVSCDRFDGDITTPSYLEIDGITVVDNPSDSWSYENGFFTSDIDAVNIVVWQRGDTAETQLGTFTLPCKVPLLKNGIIDYVSITPVVRQDGIAGKRIYYPYYEVIRIDSVRFAQDSLTNLGTLTTRYLSKSLMTVAWQDFFEPGPNATTFDSTVTRCLSSDTARSGYGCGVVRVSPDQKSVSFMTDTTFTITDPTAVVYLEMDYWSDLNFSVGLNNPTNSEGSNVILSHMTIYGKPEQGWQKIYINIGSLWSQSYNHYSKIRPYFTVLNNDGKQGNLFIDNVKLVIL